jgi:hypothetical protein
VQPQYCDATVPLTAGANVTAALFPLALSEHSPPRLLRDFVATTRYFRLAYLRCADLPPQGVTESNMMQYLGIIEQRTTEILQAYAASQIGLPNEHTLQLPSVVPADGTGKILPAIIPSYEDMSSGEDSEGEKDERPLTRQELEKRALKEFTPKMGTLAGSD